MKATAGSNRALALHPQFSRQSSIFFQSRRRICFTNFNCFRNQPCTISDFSVLRMGLFSYGVCVRPPGCVVAAVAGGRNEEPYESIPYLDEQDVVTILDPPKELIPLNPASYNPAAYLWKKIEAIPEERRHRLLQLLSPRCISRAWGIAGTRYEDPKLVKKTASGLLQNGDGQIPIGWINHFKKALFSCKDGKTYGRFIGISLLAGLANSFAPLYFEVKQLKEVMSTEQPCDLAYEFGDGLFNIHEYPEGFPTPVKHPYPFNDQLVMYVRYLGPGVLVGQAWQEGKALEQVPRKLCAEILMIKDYSPRPLQEKQ
ncbi:uncharacterized protein LOC111017125 isoform X2 [Momordica charantia]|uniref:Uncharacterized protein LOC111017125 isoform X2 n=1 Tax=Momordica charantia TaxID=3673 RepID=A0A6J1D593_MOMCH|nr:uncharacterized protein LOC111017125 isoform X2 [Momordica charantia]